MRIAGESTSSTILCDQLASGDAVIDPKLARSIVAFVALNAIDEGNIDTALQVLEKAKEKNMLSRELEELYNNIKTMIELEDVISETMKVVQQLVEKLNNNVVDEALLNKLDSMTRILEQKILEARNLGIRVDEKALRYAEEIYNIIASVKDVLPRISEIGLVAQEFSQYLTGLQQAGDVESLASKLVGLGRFSSSISKLLSAIDSGINRLTQTRITTEEARSVASALLTNLSIAKSMLESMKIVAEDSRILGLWLRQVNDWIKAAYENPSNSPFGAAREAFVKKIADIVGLIRDMKIKVNKISVPEAAPDDIRAFINGMKNVVDAIGSSILTILRNMKYYTTFNDYRWNEIWEDAERRAGVEWGNISKADVQRYVFSHCDETRCYLEEREGWAGEILERLPEEVLSFWTTVEEAINAIEMYNRWAMKYARDPYVRALGHIGYVGSSIFGAVASLAAPRMLAEGLKAFGQFLGEWFDAITSLKISRIKEMGSKTWNLLFGSKEAALATLGGALLGLGAWKLATWKLPKGAKLSLKRAILEQLIQGDVIGAALVIVERAIPMARVTGVAKALVKEGIVHASRLADDAAILSKVLKKEPITKRIQGLVALDRMSNLIKAALKNSKNLKQAHENLEKILREEGFENLTKAIEDYRVAKSTVLSNLASLKIHAPTKINKIKNVLRRTARKEVPVEELPQTLRKELTMSEELLRKIETLEKVTTKESGRRPAKQVLEALALRRIVDAEHIETLAVLDKIAGILEEAGNKRLAEAFRRVRESYEKLAGEVERTKDLIRVVNALEAVRELGERTGLWKETVEVSKRRKVPGRGWLRKVKANIKKHMDDLTNRIEASLYKANTVAESVRRELMRSLNELVMTKDLAARKIIEGLIEDLEKANLTDLAGELRAMLEYEARRTPLRARLGEALERYGEKLGKRIGELRKKYEESVEPEVAEQNAKFVATGLPRKAAKYFVAGLKVAEDLANRLKQLGDKLQYKGLGGIKDYETRIVERLADTLEKMYKETSIENLAFLKGLKEGLSYYEKTPIGTLLTELDRSLAEIIEAQERQLRGATEPELREPARTVLQQLFTADSRFFEIVAGLTRKLRDLEKRMVDLMERTHPNIREIIEKAVKIRGDPEELVSQLRKELEELAPDELSRTVQRYLELRTVETQLDELLRQVPDPAIREAIKERISKLKEYGQADISAREVTESIKEYLRASRVSESIASVVRGFLDKVDVGVPDDFWRTLERYLEFQRLQRIMDNEIRKLQSVKDKRMQRFLEELDKYMSRGDDPRKIVSDLRSYAWKNKLPIHDSFWRVLEDYLSLRPVGDEMRRMLNEVGDPEVLDAVRMAEKLEGPPSAIVETIKQYLKIKKMGPEDLATLQKYLDTIRLNVPDRFWDTLKQYLELQRIERKIDYLIDSLDNEGLKQVLREYKVMEGTPDEIVSELKYYVEAYEQASGRPIGSTTTRQFWEAFERHLQEYLRLRPVGDEMRRMLNEVGDPEVLDAVRMAEKLEGPPSAIVETIKQYLKIKKAMRGDVLPEESAATRPILNLPDGFWEALERYLAKYLESLRLERKINELAELMSLADPNISRIVKEAMEAGGDPEKLADELRKRIGTTVPDELWDTLKEYLKLRSAREALESLQKAIMGGEKISLREVQQAINKLANIDLDLAWKADWSVIQSYLSDLMGELSRTKKLAKRYGVDEVFESIEELEDTIRRVQVKEARYGPFSRITETVEMKKGYSQLLESLEETYRILENVYGKENLAGIRKLLDEFSEKLRAGQFDVDLLKKINGELRKLKWKTLPSRIRARLEKVRKRLGELATRLARGKEAGLIEKAIGELADVIKEVEESIPPVEKGWVALERVVEVAKTRFVKVPKEYAERVADILSRREKTWKFTTREGLEVEVKRRIDVHGDGRMIIKYEITFPGDRKVVYAEIVKGDPSGNVYIYKVTHHDPVIEEALKAYEEYKKGLRKADSMTRLGATVEEILSKTLSEIDPDYDVLSKIAFIPKETGLPKPIIEALADAGPELLDKIKRRLVQVAAVGGATSLSMSYREAAEEVRESVQNIPDEIYSEIEDSIKRISIGTSSPDEETIITLTKPIVAEVSNLYNTLGDPEKVLPEDTVERLSRVVGAEIKGAGIPPEDYISSINVFGGEKIDTGNMRFFVIHTSPSESILTFFANPESTVTIITPSGIEITLPAVIMDNIVAIILPPFYIELPVELEKELVASLQKQRLRQVQVPKQTIGYQSIPKTTGRGGTGGGFSPIPPILPAIPWMGGSTAASGEKQREKLNI